VGGPAPRDRAQAERQLARVWEQGLRGRRLGGGAGTGADAWASRGGAIVMRGHGRETTVVLAPDAALAARVLTRTR
jgi:hypothetical protein